MIKYLILISTLLPLISPAQSNTVLDQQELVIAGLKSAQTSLAEAISIYESQPIAINEYVEEKQNNFYLKKTDRLNIMKRALINSYNINLIVVDKSRHLAMERHKCDQAGTDTMVNKNKLNNIYICPRTLALPVKALAQVIVHELIHTAENRHEFNECETSWTEHLVMLLAGAGNPYGQQYYFSCGFIKPIKKQHNHII